jgi:hypothetical protein
VRFRECIAFAALAMCAALAVPAQAVAAQTPASIPPSLQALEQKMGELKVTSLRFSEKTSVTVPHGEGKILGLLKLLLGGGISGEETISPPAGNVVLILFGHPLTFLEVGSTTYFYLRALASKDHGRPWVKLGPGGLAELITVNGKHVEAPKIAEPKISEPRWRNHRSKDCSRRWPGPKKCANWGQVRSTVSRSRAFSRSSNRNS